MTSPNYRCKKICSIMLGKSSTEFSISAKPPDGGARQSVAAVGMSLECEFSGSVPDPLSTSDPTDSPICEQMPQSTTLFIRVHVAAVAGYLRGIRESARTTENCSPSLEPLDRRERNRSTSSRGNRPFKPGISFRCHSPLAKPALFI